MRTGRKNRAPDPCTFPVLPYNLPPTLPVLLCIWLIGAIRQKPDKEVRDRRLNENRPAPLPNEGRPTKIRTISRLTTPRPRPSARELTK
jgi:hypothetical protein